MTPSLSIKNPLLWLVLCLGFLFHLTFLDWGTPNLERSLLVFGTEERIRELTAPMVRARDELYEWVDNPTTVRPSAIHEIESPTVSVFPPTQGDISAIPEPGILNSLRSYLLRTGDPDEQQTLSGLANMNPLRGDFDPNEYRYGGGYYYALAVVLGIGMVTGLVPLSPQLDHYFLYPDELARVFAACRFLGAIAVVLSGLILYLWAERKWGRRIGLLAAVFFLCSPIVITYSHIAKPNVYAAFLNLVAVVLFDKALSEWERTERAVLPWRWTLAAGFVFGLGIGAFVISGIVLVFALIWLGMRIGFFRRDFYRLSFSLCLPVVVGFLLSNPFFLYSWENVLDLYREHASGSGWGYGLPNVSKLLSMLVGLPGTLGFVPCVALVVGWLCRREGITVAAFVSVLVLGLLMAHPRFVVPLIPYLCVVAAFGVEFLLERVQRRPARIALICAGALVILVQAGQVSSAFALDTRHRNQAGKWIADTIPMGATVGMPEDKPVLWRTPPFPFEQYTLIVFHETDVDTITQHRPDWIICQFGRVQEPPGARESLISVLEQSGYERFKVFGNPPLFLGIRAYNPCYGAVCPLTQVWRRGRSS
ncbi:MAG TPA: glycosyltransferase family 39 protein [bacterium]|nr:glycosyltransferase family 39 protein [bacterium]